MRFAVKRFRRECGTPVRCRDTIYELGKPVSGGNCDTLAGVSLCLSPQCGFASCEINNKLTEGEEFTKLALVKRIAQKV